MNDLFIPIPATHQGTLCRLKITAYQQYGTSGVSASYKAKNLSVITTRELTADASTIFPGVPAGPGP